MRIEFKEYETAKLMGVKEKVAFVPRVGDFVKWLDPEDYTAPTYKLYKVKEVGYEPTYFKTDEEGVVHFFEGEGTDTITVFLKLKA